jgi:hypothetical protein
MNGTQLETGDTQELRIKRGSAPAALVASMATASSAKKNFKLRTISSLRGSHQWRGLVRRL